MKNQIEKHTQTPWYISQPYLIQSATEHICEVAHKRLPLGDDTAKATAQFIVTACNEHDALCAVAESLEDCDADALPQSVLDALATLSTLRANTQPVLTTEK